MLDQLKKLEAVARRLDPEAQVRANWTEAVTNYANEFLNRIESSNAYSDDGDPLLIDRTEFSENGKPLDELIDILKDGIDTTGINPASGGHE